MRVFRASAHLAPASKLQRSIVMWAVLGSLVDFVHALTMVAWVLGMPLLFWHRWPRVTRTYGIYAVVFIVASQTSQWLLGECFFTTIARWCWERSDGGGSEEWFTVRVAQTVFHMTPSHRAIALVSEALILITAAGVLVAGARHRRMQHG